MHLSIYASEMVKCLTTDEEYIREQMIEVFFSDVTVPNVLYIYSEPLVERSIRGGASFGLVMTSFLNVFSCDVLFFRERHVCWKFPCEEDSEVGRAANADGLR